MSRIKLLLDLIEDVRAVANDLQMIADAMVSNEPAAESTETHIQEVPAEKDEPKVAIRLEDVRAVLAAKSRDGYGAQVRELIAKHVGNKLSEIDPSEYEAVLQEAEVFGHAT